MEENTKLFLNLNIKFCLLLAFPLILTPLLFFGESNDKKFKALFVILLTTGYSLMQAFPIHVAFLLPIILLPPLGIVDTNAVISNYMTETSVISFGLTTIAIAIQRSSLQDRLIYKILLLTGSSPKKILTGIILVSTLLSMWFHGIFIATIMAPLALAITIELDKENKSLTNEQAVVPGMESLNSNIICLNNQICPINENEEVHDSCKPMPIELAKESIYIKKALFLGIASGISIGAKGTLYGSQTAIVYMQILESQGTFKKSDLNFVSWSMYTIPIVILCLGVVWLIISTYFFGIPCSKRKNSNTTSSVESEGSNVHIMLKQRYKDLGPLRFQEIGTLSMLICLIILWFTREPKFFPGWSTLFPDQKVGDAVPAILITFLLLILPFKWPKRNEPYETFISWKYLESNYPWGVLFIFGGNFTLSDAVTKSGLSVWIEDQLVYLDNFPKEIILLILLGMCSIFTEVLSGNVCVLVLYPIVSSLAWRLELHPLYFSLPVSVACSYGFMLPSATSYAALIFTLAEGDIKISEMIKSGIWQNISCVFILFFMNIYWGEYVFNYSGYSNNVNNSTATTTRQALGF